MVSFYNYWVPHPHQGSSSAASLPCWQPPAVSSHPVVTAHLPPPCQRRGQPTASPLLRLGPPHPLLGVSHWAWGACVNTTWGEGQQEATPALSPPLAKETESNQDVHKHPSNKEL